MRVKARLTNNSIRSTISPGDSWKNDTSMTQLSRLFTTDPLVTSDADGWYLSSSELDEADELMTGAVHSEAERILTRVNGLANSLLSHYTLVHIAKLQDHRDVAVRNYMFGAFSHAVTFDTIDPEAASAITVIAESDVDVQRIIELFGHINSASFWFDIYRIWDVMKRTFINKKTFESWAESLTPQIGDHVAELEDSSNNPAHGPNRRHAGKYPPSIDRRTRLAPRLMSEGEALLYVKRVFVLWLKEVNGVTVTAQHL